MKYRIILSSEDRVRLDQIVSSGSEKARVITHARILLLSGGSVTSFGSNMEIMSSLQISSTVLLQTRKRYP
jgi:hypothetical protein